MATLEERKARRKATTSKEELAALEAEAKEAGAKQAIGALGTLASEATHAKALEPLPSLGRIVLVSVRSLPEAPAIITEVWKDGRINATVFRREGDFDFVRKIEKMDPPDYSNGMTTWRWPPRV